jgi:UDP-hydrolysing UDP-N-acetyl-D-glucosamine 2-epimerase
MGIPTAHIEGGDYTEGGALDDSVRHAMTKLAHLHFTTNQQAFERVLGLGEEPWRVFNVGLPGLDLIAAGQFAPADEVYERLDLDPKFPILVFTQHSIATEFHQAAAQVNPSLLALEEAGREWGCQTIITYPNDDAGGKAIMEGEKHLAAKGLSFIRLRPSLGRRLYHGVLNVASACVGNSSSGIKETPAFACSAVNIGDRQSGRLAAGNVLHVGYDKDQIKNAIRRSLFDEEFKEVVRTCENPYSKGGAGSSIAETLATIELSQRLIQKKMTY